jgi:Domain of unknown function (DUF4266)
MLHQRYSTIKSLFFCLVKIASVCGLLASCVHAKPWERQYHTKPEMSFTPDPLEQKMSDHVHQSKEMSGAISAGSGGGCGCY